ncbi:MAG: prolipoprotein diacylglyceryl transferase [Coxiellaceae bacterium]|nr:prolipoprotein diacylglyceryl transferase [Coxiellaceae bacterium]
MLQYPQIDPVAFAVGPLKVHWYGIMYLVGFAIAYLLARYRGPRQLKPWTKEQVADLIFYAAIGVVVGGRTGYMLFYNFGGLIANPLSYFEVWDGGMSFHGGLLGVLLAIWIYGRFLKRPFWEMGDFIAPLVPLGLAFGRIGNFINGEVWGRVTNVPWAMVFPNAGPLARHPSQLYECFFEGIVLFVILWWFSAKPRPRGAVSALFLIFYGLFRFGLEFVRQPDQQLGFIAFGWLTRGQELSIPMVLFGAGLFWYAYCFNKSTANRNV